MNKINNTRGAARGLKSAGIVKQANQGTIRQFPKRSLSDHPGYSPEEVQWGAVQPPLPDQLIVSDQATDIGRYALVKRHANGDGVYVPTEESLRHLPTILLTPEQLAID